MKQIPNYFTLLNLVCGCIAIMLILQTGEKIVYIDQAGFSSINLPERVVLGCIFIFIAAAIDFLDGFVARLLKATSAMGAQLDSLADIVSFGVAPGFIMHQLLRMSLAREEDGLDIAFAWLLPALLLPCAAAWRLAKFNLDSEQKMVFKGVPTPAVGLLIAALPFIIFYDDFGAASIFTNKWVLYLIILILSYLMVSPVKMLSLKIAGTKPSENIPLIILAVVAIASAIILKWLAAPVIFLSYVILSLVFKSKKN